MLGYILQDLSHDIQRTSKAMTLACRTPVSCGRDARLVPV